MINRFAVVSAVGAIVFMATAGIAAAYSIVGSSPGFKLPNKCQCFFAIRAVGNVQP